MEKDVIFIVIGYEIQTDQGVFLNSCQIEVYSKSETEAIKQAEKYIKKPHYKVIQIIEKK